MQNKLEKSDPWQNKWCMVFHLAYFTVKQKAGKQMFFDPVRTN